MLKECVDHVIQTLATADLTAVPDARDLSLPGVWVTLDQFGTESLTDGGTVTLAVTLVSSQAPGEALGELQDMLAQVLTVLHPEPVWTAASIRLPNHSRDPLPCLRGTVTLEWSPS